jgi:hypothetical protein
MTKILDNVFRRRIKHTTFSRVNFLLFQIEVVTDLSYPSEKPLSILGRWTMVSTLLSTIKIICSVSSASAYNGMRYFYVPSSHAIIYESPSLSHVIAFWLFLETIFTPLFVSFCFHAARKIVDECQHIYYSLLSSFIRFFLLKFYILFVLVYFIFSLFPFPSFLTVVDCCITVRFN